MTKKNLVELIKRVLKTDVNLDFLLKLEPRELEILVAWVRDRMDQVEG